MVDRSVPGFVANSASGYRRAIGPRRTAVTSRSPRPHRHAHSRRTESLRVENAFRRRRRAQCLLTHAPNTSRKQLRELQYRFRLPEVKKASRCLAGRQQSAPTAFVAALAGGYIAPSGRPSGRRHERGVSPGPAGARHGTAPRLSRARRASYTRPARTAKGSRRRNSQLTSIQLPPTARLLPRVASAHARVRPKRARGGFIVCRAAPPHNAPASA